MISPDFQNSFNLSKAETKEKEKKDIACYIKEVINDDIPLEYKKSAIDF